MNRAAIAWLVGGDTGISSKAICSHMMIGTVHEYGHPRDNSDLGRCIRLLDLVPEWRDRLYEMARYSPEWAALWSDWPELERMYREDPNDPALYDKMRSLLNSARVCIDCGVVGPSAWSVYGALGRRIRCYKCARAHESRGAA